MGRGPSENANDGRRKLFDWEAAKETGTLAQFLKLRRYKKAVVSQTSPIPVGEHPELDSLETVLKAGAKVAFRAQIAIFLPCLVGMVLFLASFAVMAGVIGALEGDKQTILGVVETGAGDGILGFNSAVRMLVNSEDGPEVVPTSKKQRSKASLSAARVAPAAKGFTGADPSTS